MASKSDPPPATSSTGSVSFKAYLSARGNDKPKEVRRFGMEQNEVTSFDLLKKKLRQVFPSIATSDFTIMWKDFEGDNIIISSNDELLTALTECTDQVHRLYIESKGSVGGWPPFGCFVDVVRPVETADPNDSEEEEEDLFFTPPGCKRSWQSAARTSSVKVHPNVYCDGCNKIIAGHRYKCLECDDYDLCHDCESKLMHKEHIMIRIPLTMSHYPKLNNFSKSMRCMSDALRKIDNRFKKQERRLQKFMELNKRCDDFVGVAEEMLQSKRCKRDEKEKEKEKDKERRDRKKPSFYHDASSGTSAQANARAGAHCFTSRAKASGSKETPASAQAPSGGCPFPAGILGNLLNPQNLATLQQLIQHLSPVPEQLLQEVSQSLADVRLNDTAPASAPSAPTGNPFSSNSKGAAAADCDDAAAPSSSSAPEQETQDKPEKSAASASAEPASQVAADVLDAPNSQSGRSSRSSSADVEGDEWTVVDNQAREGSGGQPAVYPKLPTVEPTPAPQPPVPSEPEYQGDPKVKMCLQALKDMGYDVRDRLIIDLAEEYQGNLNRVLNVLLS